MGLALGLLADMGLALGLLILFFAARAVGRLPWSKYLGWVIYQLLLTRSRLNTDHSPKAFYVDKTGFYSIRQDD